MGGVSFEPLRSTMRHARLSFASGSCELRRLFRERPWREWKLRIALRQKLHSNGVPIRAAVLNGRERRGYLL